MKRKMVLACNYDELVVSYARECMVPKLWEMRLLEIHGAILVHRSIVFSTVECITYIINSKDPGRSLSESLQIDYVFYSYRAIGTNG
jgi:hypothetical protein